ncbi:MAG TPA: PAS domain S-box protein [Pirellulales bacterium]|nr:PAS domain S-box protein [Pirellulales bacterium]
MRRAVENSLGEFLRPRVLLDLLWRLKLPLLLVGLVVVVAVESVLHAEADYVTLYCRLAALGLIIAVWATIRTRARAEHRVFELIQDVCCIANFDGTIVSINPAAQQLFGYNATELIGTPFMLLIHPEDREKAGREIRQMVMGAKTPEVEIRCRAKDGSYKWVRWTSMAAPGDSFFITTGRDATATREADYNLARLSAVLDQTEDAIISKSLDDRITAWNRAAERLLGYTAEEIVGRDASILVPVDRAGEETLMLAKLRVGLYVGQTNTARRRKDGTLIQVALTMSLIRDRQHNIVGVSMIMRGLDRDKAAVARPTTMVAAAT